MLDEGADDGAGVAVVAGANIVARVDVVVGADNKESGADDGEHGADGRECGANARAYNLW